jgi:hypothetical protein
MYVWTVPPNKNKCHPKYGQTKINDGSLLKVTFSCKIPLSLKFVLLLTIERQYCKNETVLVYILYNYRIN